MRLFIASHFNKLENKFELEKLNSIVRSSGCEVFNFVTTYTKPFNNDHEMMALAKAEISKSDALLVDVSEKSTGRMVETGIAFALGKKIILICRTGSVIKDTLNGISDFIVEYQTVEDIQLPLKNYLTKLIN